MFHLLLFESSLLPQMAGTPFGGLGAPNMEQIAAMGIQGPNMNPQVGATSTSCFLRVKHACPRS